ncbi:hypothetical protein BN946_scf184902.g2 [Trametes cinnabarina]|uniref:HAT C-terminal dimerisation domain-containing protein n=1 Tax=Pycnoporus cinnabarinus TaxID=5643 RepID=A0A060SY50_PYCCI|nr:hypothetical protein BN946_scf184902.g2 [Trametes cinnabarina]
MMSNFVEEGRKSPVKELTRKGFREHFVKGLIEDDLPYTFGSRKGMSRCFKYILPKGFKVPDRMMVWRDLSILHKKIRERLNTMIKDNSSKLSIASDNWTSKNSVYAFSGLAVYWITDNWKLVEYPLELLPLDGNHTGTASAKLIYKALCRCHATRKLSMSFTLTADNASFNGKMNRVLSRLITQGDGILLDPKDIQMGDFLHALGLAPDPDIVDLYEGNRKFLLAFDPEQDPDFVEHSAKAQQEANDIADGHVDDDDRNADPDDSADSDSERESGSEPDNDLLDDKPLGCTSGLGTTKKAKKRIFTPVDKLCSKNAQHLVPIRSMPVQWNTTYAEIEHGLLLRLAINQWIEQLDKDTTGKKAAGLRVKKRRWYLSPEDWEILEAICTILKPFHDVTHQLSHRSMLTIPVVLPLYKCLQQHLEKTQGTLRKDQALLRMACGTALEKLKKYIRLTLVSKYPLLGAEIASRARALLEELYSKYAADAGPGTGLGSAESGKSPTGMHGSKTQPISVFGTAVNAGKGEAGMVEEESEVDWYLKGTYPSRTESDVLKWWKVRGGNFGGWQVALMHLMSDLVS